MATPAHQRRLGIIVIGIIVFRHRDRQALTLVPQVFVLEVTRKDANNR